MALKCVICGAPLKPGHTKCSYCGTEIKIEGANVVKCVDTASYSQASPSYSDSMCVTSLFSSDNWKKEWEKAQDDKVDVGIILTNTSALMDRKPFFEKLDLYIKNRKKDGVLYHLLDVATQKIKPSCSSLEDHLELLQTIYEVSTPVYLMIIGDYSVIPCIRYDNYIEDGDNNIPSDLPYITLDSTTIWDCLNYDFENLTPVGRIPTKAKTNFLEAIHYMDHAMEFSSISKVEMLEYSAKRWESTSKNIIKEMKADFYTSPQCCYGATYESFGCRDIGRLSDKYNFLSFNLHGAEEGYDWYGENNGFYPVAYAPEALPNTKKNYVVCSEACYGAKPTIEVGEESTLIKALSNYCLGFVASTRIAYGDISGSLSNADIIAKTFDTNVLNGKPLGLSFLKALNEVYKGEEIYDTEVKTVAEFGFYGDPSIQFVTNYLKDFEPKKRKCYEKVKKDSSNRIELLAFNRNAEIKPLNKNNINLMSYNPLEVSKIKQCAKVVCVESMKFVQKMDPSFKNVEPMMFRAVGKSGFGAVFKKENDKVKTIVKVYMDDDGNVQKTYYSK